MSFFQVSDSAGEYASGEESSSSMENDDQDTHNINVSQKQKQNRNDRKKRNILWRAMPAKLEDKRSCTIGSVANSL